MSFSLDSGKLVVGITGKMLTGKSTFRKALALNAGDDAHVIDMDTLAKQVLYEQHHSETLQFFGFDPFDQDGKLRTELLSCCIFLDVASYERFTQFASPLIKNALVNSISRASQRIVVFESAQLYQSGLDELCSIIVEFQAPTEILLARASSRGFSEAEVLERLRFQDYVWAPASTVRMSMQYNTAFMSEIEVQEAAELFWQDIKRRR